MEIDRYDRQILQVLQDDGRISNQDLADRIGLSPSPCLRRVRTLGRATYAQSEALRQRLADRGLDGRYVEDYLAWRRGPWWRRMSEYRKYYVGPELDRCSRLLLW